MDSQFTVDSRKVCSDLCLYNGHEMRIKSWIKVHRFKENKDFISHDDGSCSLTPEAATKIRWSYLDATQEQLYAM